MAYHPKLKKGQRVKLGPHLDLWMQGCRYGTIYCRDHKRSGVCYKVRLDHPAKKRLVSLWNQDIEPIE